MGPNEIRAGGAYVEAYVKDDNLQKGAAKINTTILSLGRTLATIGASLAGIGVAIRAPLQAAAHVFADTGSELVKLSRETGFTVESLSELKYAAEQSNQSLEAVIKQVKAGENDFAALRQEARQLGIVMTEAEAIAGNGLRQALSSLKAVLSSITNQIGSAVAPVIQESTELFRKWSAVTLAWIKNHKPLFETLAKIGAGLVIAGTALATFGGAISAVGTGLGIMASILSAILSPLGVVSIALAGAGYAFFRFTAAGQATLEWFKQQLPQLKAITAATFGGIHDALAAGDLSLAVKTLWAGIKTVWYQGLDDINKVWMGTFRIMGAAVTTLAFDIADKINAAIVTVETKWQEFSAFMIETADAALTGIAVAILQKFAGALLKLETAWNDLWAYFFDTVQSVLLKVSLFIVQLFNGQLFASAIVSLGNMIQQTLIKAFLAVSSFALKALTFAVTKPLELIAQMPGAMGAAAAKILGTVGAKTAEMQIGLAKMAAGMLQGNGPGAEAGPKGPTMAERAMGMAAELRNQFLERQAGRANGDKDAANDPANKGAIRGNWLADMQKNIMEMIFKARPDLANAPGFKAAQEELANAIKEAARKVEEANKRINAGGLAGGAIGRGGAGILAGANAALGIVKQMSSTGTFSAAQAAGLGGSPVVGLLTRIAKAAEKTAGLGGAGIVAGAAGAVRFGP
jgi:hypothetical protein